MPIGKLKIVDISRSRYTQTSFNSVITTTKTAELEMDGTNVSADENTNDCLGIFPVITTATNAIWT